MSEELEIEINASGQVLVHVKGRPGPACLDYIEVFRTLLEGRVEEVEKTPEFYQASTGQSVQPQNDQHLTARWNTTR